MGEGLILEQLFYSQELRSFEQVPIGEGDVKDEELALAVQLIEKKIEGEEITAAPEVEADDKIVDLMEALKASLGTGDGPAESKDRKPTKRASSRGKGKDKKRAAR